MKSETILLVDVDGDCEESVARAAARSGRTVRWVSNCRDAFRVLNDELRGLALIIVDLDPGAHGMSLLEAVSACAEAPAILVLSALEETYAKPIACKHGAATCFGKPIDIDKLSRAIDYVASHEFPDADLWGHPRPHPAHGRRAVQSAVRGITAKLSPHLEQGSA